MHVVSRPKFRRREPGENCGGGRRSSTTSPRRRNSSRRPRSATRRSPRSPRCCAGSSRHEAAPAVAFLTGSMPDGRIGVGWATLVERAGRSGDRRATLTVLEVADALATHRRARRARARFAIVTNCCRSLLGRATEREQRLLVGDPRWRAAPGCARRRDDVGGRGRRRRSGRVDPAGVDDDRRPARPRRRVALDRRARGARRRRRCEPSRPVLPMLASPSTDVVAALAATGPASVEWKLDGARLQAHRAGRRGAPVHPQPQRRHRSAARHRRHRRRACPAATSCSTARRSACSTTARRDGSRTRWATSAPTAIGGRGSGLRAFFFDVLHVDGVTACTTSRCRCDASCSQATVPAERLGCRRSSPPIPVEAEAFLRAGDRRRPRGRDGEGPRAARTRQGAAVRRGAR